MINEIVNDKLNKVTIYCNISGYSAYSYKEFFIKEIGIIIGRTNGKLIECFLNSNDTTKEIKILKVLFKREYFKIIEIFIKYVKDAKNKENIW